MEGISPEEWIEVTGVVYRGFDVAQVEKETGMGWIRSCMSSGVASPTSWPRPSLLPPPPVKHPAGEGTDVRGRHEGRGEQGLGTRAHPGHIRGRRIADGFRAAAVLSVGVAAVWFGVAEVAGFILVAVGLLIPRLFHLAGPFDAAFGATILLASWSSVASLYAAITWWDIMVHFVTAGSSAGVLFLLLSRAEITPAATVGRALPRRSIVVMTFSFGLTIAVLWEFVEWAGNAFISSDIHVGYIDTLIDLAVGGAGAILVGVLLAQWKEKTSRIQAWAGT